MKAVVLAAGEGTRLGPLGKSTIKCLLPFGHKLIIDHLCDSILEAGISEIIIVGGYKFQDLKSYIGNDFSLVENIEYNE